MITHLGKPLKFDDSYSAEDIKMVVKEKVMTYFIYCNQNNHVIGRRPDSTAPEIARKCFGSHLAKIQK